MAVETERRPTAERTLTITLEDGRELSFPNQLWYCPYSDIAKILGKNRATVSINLHTIRKNDPSIQVTTVRELKMSGKLGELGFEATRLTIICDQDNFIRLLIAAASRTNASKEKKPEKPSSHAPFNKGILRPERTPEGPQKAPITKTEITDPKGILAINSVIKALSHLANGTLKKNIPNNIKEFLGQVATEHVRLPRFEDDSRGKSILREILDNDSPNRLNRFFKVNLEAMLYDLWDVIDTNERISKEEKKTIEICNRLKEKGYDKERAAQELFDHFQPQVQPKHISENVILPSPLPPESPRTAAPIYLKPAPIQKKETIFELNNRNSKSKEHRKKTKRTTGEKKPHTLTEEDEQRLQGLQEEMLLRTSVRVLKNLAENRYTPDVRIILGYYLPRKMTIPQIFGNASQKELNNLVVEKLHAALRNGPDKDQILSKVKSILESGLKPAP